MRGREQQKHDDVAQGLGMATIPMLPPWHHPSHQCQAAKGMPPAGYCSSPWPKPTSSPCYPSPAASATQKGATMLVARRRVISTPCGTRTLAMPPQPCMDGTQAPMPLELQQR